MVHDRERLLTWNRRTSKNDDVVVYHWHDRKEFRRKLIGVHDLIWIGVRLSDYMFYVTRYGIRGNLLEGANRSKRSQFPLWVESYIFHSLIISKLGSSISDFYYFYLWTREHFNTFINGDQPANQIVPWTCDVSVIQVSESGRSECDGLLWR